MTTFKCIITNTIGSHVDLPEHGLTLNIGGISHAIDLSLEQLSKLREIGLTVEKVIEDEMAAVEEKVTTIIAPSPAPVVAPVEPNEPAVFTSSEGSQPSKDGEQQNQ